MHKHLRGGKLFKQEYIVVDVKLLDHNKQHILSCAEYTNEVLKKNSYACRIT